MVPKPSVLQRLFPVRLPVDDLRFVVTLILLSTCPAGYAYTQTEAYDLGRLNLRGPAVVSASDYLSIGVNPANLGFEPVQDVYRLSSPLHTGVVRSKRSFTLGSGDVAFTIHSDALNRSELWDLTRNVQADIGFTAKQQEDAAQAFSNNGIRFSMSALIGGVSYHSGDYGGVALAVRERISGSLHLNDAVARLAFQGRYYSYFDTFELDWKNDTIGMAKNPRYYSDIFGGTSIQLLWMREFAIAYGLRVYASEAMDVYAGVGVRYLSGIGFLDAEIHNNHLRAYSALAPGFAVDYGKATSPSMVTGSDFRAIGKGWGADVGITVRSLRWTFAASIIDVGEMKWFGNVFTAMDTVLNGVTSEGFSSYNLFREAPRITGQGDFFLWDGLSGVTSRLPTRLRFGFSHEYSSAWNLGAEFMIPTISTTASMVEPTAFGIATFRPLVWLRLTAGFGVGGRMAWIVPISASISILDGLWEMGIGVMDGATFITSKRPMIGITATIARIRL